MKLYVGLEGEFNGVYVAHWEVTRFVYCVERKWAGLITHWEECQLVMGKSVKEPWFNKWDGQMPDNWIGGPGLTFDVSFAGKVIEKGQFGFRGECHWRIQVNQFLSVVEQSQK